MNHLGTDNPIPLRIKVSLSLITLLVFNVLIQPFFIQCAYPSDSPFNRSSNWGGTGLMEIPNARVLEDGVIRLGAADASPYRWYTAGMGILPGVEFTGRLTNVTNIPTPYVFSELDRAFDLKFQIIPESKTLPAIAVGIDDFEGTRLFSSEYLAISRQIYPLDLTLGLGTERLKGSAPLFDRVGIFGGVELALNDRISLMAEYNPVRYEDDPRSVRGIPEGAESPVNFGIRADIIEGLNLGISYQRGDTLSASLHLQFELGRQILPQRPDPPLLIPVDQMPFSERDQGDMVNNIHDAIRDAGFSNVSVRTDGRTVTAEFENTKYMSCQKAAGRVLRILLYYSPKDCEKLTVVEKTRDMPVLEVSVSPSHLEMYLMGKISEEIFYSDLLDIKTVSGGSDNQDGYILKSDPDAEKDYSIGIKPDLTTFWLDSSDYVQVRAGLKPYIIANPWKGALAYARFDIPFYSDVYASAKPSSIPVRTDQADYLDVNYTFDRLMINQIFPLSDQGFGRVSVGYFDKMYAGIGGETLFFPGEGGLALGIEGDWVVKREPGAQFELTDFTAYSALANVYYYYRGLDITLHAQYGRFLAGDMGWMFEASREFDTGAVVGFYYSYTDTDIFEEKYNRDYNNKGVYLSMPLRTFLSHDSVEMLNYGITPWTRDVAATVPHWQGLYDSVKRLMPAMFRSGISELKD